MPSLSDFLTMGTSKLRNPLYLVCVECNQIAAPVKMRNPEIF